MNKIFILILISLGLFHQAQAQKQETLANSGRIQGGFGALLFPFSQADGHSGAGAGAGGAIIVNDFFIGGYGQGESFDRHRYNGRNYFVGLNSGGIWLGYTYPSHKVLHLYTSMKIGWGSATLNRDDNDPFDNDQINDGVVVLNPEIGAELNILRWFRLGITGGYRLVGGLNTLPGYASNDFNSPTLALTLRFGKFGKE